MWPDANGTADQAADIARRMVMCASSRGRDADRCESRLGTLLRRRTGVF
jgi:hypothetical protein